MLERFLQEGQEETEAMAMPGRPAGYKGTDAPVCTNWEQELSSFLEFRLNKLGNKDPDLLRHVRSVVGVFKQSPLDICQDLELECEDYNPAAEGMGVTYYRRYNPDQLTKMALTMELKKMTNGSEREVRILVEQLMVYYKHVTSQSDISSNKERVLREEYLASSNLSRCDEVHGERMPSKEMETRETSCTKAFPALSENTMIPHKPPNSPWQQRVPLSCMGSAQSARNKIGGENGVELKDLTHRKIKSNGKENEYCSPSPCLSEGDVQKMMLKEILKKKFPKGKIDLQKKEGQKVQKYKVVLHYNPKATEHVKGMLGLASRNEKESLQFGISHPKEGKGTAGLVKADSSSSIGIVPTPDPDPTASRRNPVNLVNTRHGLTSRCPDDITQLAQRTGTSNFFKDDLKPFDKQFGSLQAQPAHGHGTLHEKLSLTKVAASFHSVAFRDRAQEVQADESSLRTTALPSKYVHESRTAQSSSPPVNTSSRYFSPLPVNLDSVWSKDFVSVMRWPDSTNSNVDSKTSNSSVSRHSEQRKVMHHSDWPGLSARPMTHPLPFPSEPSHLGDSQPQWKSIPALASVDQPEQRYWNASIIHPAAPPSDNKSSLHSYGTEKENGRRADGTRHSEDRIGYLDRASSHPLPGGLGFFPAFDHGHQQIPYASSHLRKIFNSGNTTSNATAPPSDDTSSLCSNVTEEENGQRAGGTSRSEKDRIGPLDRAPSHPLPGGLGFFPAFGHDHQNPNTSSHLREIFNSVNATSNATAPPSDDTPSSFCSYGTEKENIQKAVGTRRSKKDSLDSASSHLSSDSSGIIPAGDLHTWHLICQSDTDSQLVHSFTSSNNTSSTPYPSSGYTTSSTPNLSSGDTTSGYTDSSTPDPPSDDTISGYTNSSTPDPPSDDTISGYTDSSTSYLSSDDTTSGYTASSIPYLSSDDTISGYTDSSIPYLSSDDTISGYTDSSIPYLSSDDTTSGYTDSSTSYLSSGDTTSGYTDSSTPYPSSDDAPSFCSLSTCTEEGSVQGTDCTSCMEKEDWTRLFDSSSPCFPPGSKTDRIEYPESASTPSGHSSFGIIPACDRDQQQYSQQQYDQQRYDQQQYDQQQCPCCSTWRGSQYVTKTPTCSAATSYQPFQCYNTLSFGDKCGFGMDNNGMDKQGDGDQVGLQNSPATLSEKFTEKPSSLHHIPPHPSPSRSRFTRNSPSALQPADQAVLNYYEQLACSMASDILDPVPNHTQHSTWSAAAYDSHFPMPNSQQNFTRSAALSDVFPVPNSGQHPTFSAASDVCFRVPDPRQPLTASAAHHFVTKSHHQWAWSAASQAYSPVNNSQQHSQWSVPTDAFLPVHNSQQHSNHSTAPGAHGSVSDPLQYWSTASDPQRSDQVPLENTNWSTAPDNVQSASADPLYMSRRPSTLKLSQQKTVFKNAPDSDTLMQAVPSPYNTTFRSVTRGSTAPDNVQSTSADPLYMSRRPSTLKLSQQKTVFKNAPDSDILNQAVPSPYNTTFRSVTRGSTAPDNVQSTSADPLYMSRRPSTLKLSQQKTVFKNAPDSDTLNQAVPSPYNTTFKSVTRGSAAPDNVQSISADPLYMSRRPSTLKLPQQKTVFKNAPDSDTLNQAVPSPYNTTFRSVTRGSTAPDNVQSTSADPLYMSRRPSTLKLSQQKTVFKNAPDSDTLNQAVPSPYNTTFRSVTRGSAAPDTVQSISADPLCMSRRPSTLKLSQQKTVFKNAPDSDTLNQAVPSPYNTIFRIVTRGSTAPDNVQSTSADPLYMSRRPSTLKLPQQKTVFKNAPDSDTLNQAVPSPYNTTFKSVTRGSAAPDNVQSISADPLYMSRRPSTLKLPQQKTVFKNAPDSDTLNQAVPSPYNTTFRSVTRGSTAPDNVQSTSADPLYMSRRPSTLKLSQQKTVFKNAPDSDTLNQAVPSPYNTTFRSVTRGSAAPDTVQSISADPLCMSRRPSTLKLSQQKTVFKNAPDSDTLNQAVPSPYNTTFRSVTRGSTAPDNVESTLADPLYMSRRPSTLKLSQQKTVFKNAPDSDTLNQAVPSPYNTIFRIVTRGSTAPDNVQSTSADPLYMSRRPSTLKLPQQKTVFKNAPDSDILNQAVPSPYNTPFRSVTRGSTAPDNVQSTSADPLYMSRRPSTLMLPQQKTVFKNAPDSDTLNQAVPSPYNTTFRNVTRGSTAPDNVQSTSADPLYMSRRPSTLKLSQQKTVFKNAPDSDTLNQAVPSPYNTTFRSVTRGSTAPDNVQSTSADPLYMSRRPSTLMLSQAGNPYGFCGDPHIPDSCSLERNSTQQKTVFKNASDNDTIMQDISDTIMQVIPSPHNSAFRSVTGTYSKLQPGPLPSDHCSFRNPPRQCTKPVYLVQDASSELLSKLRQNQLTVIIPEEPELAVRSPPPEPDLLMCCEPESLSSFQNEGQSKPDAVPDFVTVRKKSKETQTTEPYLHWTPTEVEQKYVEKSWKEFKPLTEMDRQRDLMHLWARNAHNPVDSSGGVVAEQKQYDVEEKEQLRVDVSAIENDPADYSELSDAIRQLPPFQSSWYVGDLQELFFLSDIWTSNQHRHRSGRNREKTRRPLHPNKPCSFFLEGCRFRADCKYSHDISTITCHFWEEGQCFKGDLCPFLHGYLSALDKNALEPTHSENYSPLGHLSEVGRKKSHHHGASAPKRRKNTKN